MPPTDEQPLDSKVNNVWVTQSQAMTGEHIKLPSGQIVLARRMGVDAMIEAGILTEAESLAALVMEGPVTQGKTRMQGHKKPAKDQAADDEQAMLRKVLDDPQLLKAMITMADKAMPHIVLEPKVDHHIINIAGRAHKRTPSQRESDVIYTDQIGFEDKMFLFDWATGSMTESMSDFREQSASPVDAVGDESGVSRPAKPARRKSR